METCVESKGWQKEGFAPSQVVTLNDREDGVRARFVPSSGDGWKIECQGKSYVGFQQCKAFYQLFLCTRETEQGFIKCNDFLHACVSAGFHFCRFCCMRYMIQCTRNTIDCLQYSRRCYLGSHGNSNSVT